MGCYLKVGSTFEQSCRIAIVTAVQRYIHIQPEHLTQHSTYRTAHGHALIWLGRCGMLLFSTVEVEVRNSPTVTSQLRGPNCNNNQTRTPLLATKGKTEDKQNVIAVSRIPRHVRVASCTSE
jgi:hypothetical protein